MHRHEAEPASFAVGVALANHALAFLIRLSEMPLDYVCKIRLRDTYYHLNIEYY